MSVVYYTASTLDGFLADDHDSLDWLLSQDIDPEGAHAYEPFVAGVGALVMGSTTYEWLRARIVSGEESWPYAQPTWVLSSRPREAVPGADVRFASGAVGGWWPPGGGAADGRDVWVVGGGDLAGQLVEAGHLDRILVSIAPVTLGSGRPLLPRPVDLRLVEVEQNRAFVCATYDVVGPR